MWLASDEWRCAPALPMIGDTPFCPFSQKCVGSKMPCTASAPQLRQLVIDVAP